VPSRPPPGRAWSGRIGPSTPCDARRAPRRATVGPCGSVRGIADLAALDALLQASRGSSPSRDAIAALIESEAPGAVGSVRGIAVEEGGEPFRDPRPGGGRDGTGGLRLDVPNRAGARAVPLADDAPWRGDLAALDALLQASRGIRAAIASRLGLLPREACSKASSAARSPRQGASSGGILKFRRSDYPGSQAHRHASRPPPRETDDAPCLGGGRDACRCAWLPG
jgi:hypothetical protein